jgi:hypothetical protein
LSRKPLDSSRAARSPPVGVLYEFAPGRLLEPASVSDIDRNPLNLKRLYQCGTVIAPCYPTPEQILVPAGEQTGKWKTPLGMTGTNELDNKDGRTT